MSYDELKQAAWEANMELNRRGLVLYTWGNVSQVDRERGVLAIKPSGVPYERLSAADMVVVDTAGPVDSVAPAPSMALANRRLPPPQPEPASSLL